jgi:hypothetical protein
VDGFTIQKAPVLFGQLILTPELASKDKKLALTRQSSMRFKIQRRKLIF